MGPNYTAGDPVHEAQPLLSDHGRDHDHQHAEGSGSLPPSPAWIPKTTLLQDENLEEEPTTDGGYPLRGLTEAERLALIDSLPWNRRPSTLWLGPFVLTLALMIGIGMAAQDQQINSIICKDYLRGKGDPVIGDWDKQVCDSAEIQAFAAIITSHLSSIKNIFGVFAIGYYTTQSDRRGRKFLIYLSLVPGVFSQLLIIHMGKPHSNLGLWPLYVNAVLTGCLGAGSLLEPGLNAYLGRGLGGYSIEKAHGVEKTSSVKKSDFTSRDKRSLAIGYAMVTLSIGVLIGTVIGKAVYDGTQDNNIVLMVAMVTSVCLILYTIALPESRPKEVRIAEASRMHHSPLRSSKESMSFPNKAKQLLKQTLEPLLFFLPGRIDPTENELPTRNTLLLLVGAYACGQFASNGIMAVFIPYSKLVYRWGTSENGTYIIVFGLSTLVVYLVVFPGLQYAYKYFIKTTDSIQLPIKDNNMDIEDVSAILQHVSANTGVHIADIAIVTAIEPAHVPVDRATQDDSIKRDLSFFVLGGVLFAVGFVIVPIFDTDIILLISCVIHSLASIGLTAFTSLMTAYVPSYQTGKALGGIAILDAILQASAALLYASIFAATAGTVPSTVYFVSAGMWVVSVVVTMVILEGYRRRWA
ncbi:hypothetical protein EC957_004988 [Mortierella hygrophila]|uniref:MFS general substrate transporter n=1 Tax=Mortierella hygrophila TaxID=979708 RepID=A0A9P6FFK9_9FUNG|nr:hypothetical protein EC957_004988 [Mortierella hygrophila]